ncbi:MAG: FadR family transcriptional regulator [Caulobacter sp.]|nr:FadR family transcriptional regulator [Caulobacter sp.]
MLPHDLLLAELEDRLALWASPKTGRLPSERELAQRLAVTRPELRKALGILETQGRIRRQVGSGTFLTPTGETAPEIADRTVLRTSPRVAMEARFTIEPQLAWLAAQNATPQQIAELRRLCTEMQAAESWEGYAELDWRFHNLIGKATENVLLDEIQQLLNLVRRRVVWGDLDTSSPRPPPGYHSFKEHEAIVAGIEAHSPDAAEAAMRRHLDATRQRLLTGATAGAAEAEGRPAMEETSVPG